MPKWKKDAKEFTVSVNFNQARGYQSSIPKPVMEALGEPQTLTFVIAGGTVKIQPNSLSTNENLKVETSNKTKRSR